MQYDIKHFDPEDHEKFRALSVKQPYASNLAAAAYIDENGVKFGIKSIEVRSKNTKFRGDLLICSSVSPKIYGLESGVSIGLVELYDVKKISDFTPYDWECTGIPKAERYKYKKGFGWMMKNPRRVIEFPVKGQLGIFTLVYTKDTIIQYPEKVVMDKESYLLTQKSEA